MSEVIERLAILETELKNLHKRMDQYDGERSWLVKTVLGVLIAAIIGIIIQRVSK